MFFLVHLNFDYIRHTDRRTEVFFSRPGVEASHWEGLIIVSRKKLIIYFCNYLNSDNNDHPYDSDSILEVSALSWPFCLRCCGTIWKLYSSCKKVWTNKSWSKHQLKQCRAGWFEWWLGRWQKCFFCQKLFKTKYKVEENFIFHQVAL